MQMLRRNGNEISQAGRAVAQTALSSSAQRDITFVLANLFKNMFSSSSSDFDIKKILSSITDM